MRAVVVGLLLATLVAGGPAAAHPEPLDAAFSNTGSTLLAGDLNLDWQAAALSIKSGGGEHPGALAITGSHVAGRLVNLPHQRAVANPPMAQAVVLNLPAPEEDGAWQDLAGGAAALFGAGPQEEVRVVPTDGKAFGVPALHLQAMEVAPPGTSPADNPDSSFSSAHQIDGIVSYPLPPFFLAQAKGWAAANLTGPFRLFVAGPTVVLPDGSRHATGMRLNASRSAIDPATGSGHYVYDNWVYEVRADALQLTPQGVASQVAARTADGTLTGRGSWHGMRGQSRLANATLPAAQDTLDTAGAFEVHAASTSQSTEWRVAGPASSVLVDRVAWLRAPAVVAGGAAVGLALLGLLLLDSLRSGLTFLLGRTTPALLRPRPAASPTRRDILRAVHEHQPVTLADLGARTGHARGTLRYHLRVLLSCEMLQALPPNGHASRNLAYVLNSSSLLFDAPGLAALPEGGPDAVAGRALASVNSSPVRRAIHAFLLAHGPADFEAIQAHLLATGTVAQWPHSTASHQLRQLEGAHAIAAVWRNRRKLYAANLDPAAARIQQYANYLQSHGISWLTRSLHAAGPLSLEQIWRAQDGTAWVGSRRRLRRRLEDLTAAAFLAYDPAARTYRLEQPLAALAPSILQTLGAP